MTLPRSAVGGTAVTELSFGAAPIGNMYSAVSDDGFDVPAMHRRVWDFSRDGVLRSLDESLGRLGLDRVDIVFIHDPDHHWRQAVEEAYPAVARLHDEGVVDAIGVGMNQAEMLADFVRSTDIDLVMLAGRYTLLEQGALDDLLPMCATQTTTCGTRRGATIPG